MSFTFSRNGSDAAIMHDGVPILSLKSNQMNFGGAFWAKDQWMKPGGGPEVAVLPLFSTYSAKITDVSYKVNKSSDKLSLIIVPSETHSGKAFLRKFTETDILTVQLKNNRYIWTQEMILKLNSDLQIGTPETDKHLHVYYYPRPDGKPGKYIQYADPQPVGASGPAVPMTNDWLYQPEPYVGPESYRKSWRRRYSSILFQNPDKSYSYSDLNKTKWYHLTLDNRCARPCHPKGMLYLLKDNGEALAGKCDAPSHFHHVCEWGMDYHYWLDLEPFIKNGVLKKGTEIRATTEWRLADAAETAPLIKKAKRIELTKRERFFADLPAYEEPENTFTVSALDRLDAQAWNPTSEGCSWNRKGGKTAGSGCLVIHNNFSSIGEWIQGALGPSQWGNPFVPGGKYRLSAWVKVDENEWNGNHSGPQIGVTFNQYNGPASVSPSVVVQGGWSPALFTLRNFAYTENVDWTRIELITTAPSYALSACLHLRFQGRGKASFSNVRWEQVME